MPRRPILAGCQVCLLMVGSATAGTCLVPGAQHASIQQAADDVMCGMLQIAPGIHAQSARVRRDLEMVGNGSETTVIEGRLEVVGPVAVTLSGFAIANGCPQPALQVVAGASVAVQDLHVSAAIVPCPELSYPIFRSGFEFSEVADP